MSLTLWLVFVLVDLLSLPLICYRSRKWEVTLRSIKLNSIPLLPVVVGKPFVPGVEFQRRIRDWSFPMLNQLWFKTLPLFLSQLLLQHLHHHQPWLLRVMLS